MAEGEIIIRIRDDGDDKIVTVLEGSKVLCEQVLRRSDPANTFSQPARTSMSFLIACNGSLVNAAFTIQKLNDDPDPTQVVARKALGMKP